VPRCSYFWSPLAKTKAEQETQKTIRRRIDPGPYPPSPALKSPRILPRRNPKTRPPAATLRPKRPRKKRLPRQTWRRKSSFSI